MGLTRIKVLFTGGSGTISASCVAHCIDLGMDVFVVNRGLSEKRRPFPEGVTVLRADVHDKAALNRALGDLKFDAVVDFLTYTLSDAQRSIEVFRSRTQQFLYISTTAIYRKPSRIPIVESAPRGNPFSRYAQQKKEAEDIFIRAYEEDDFAVTIVRPSHTYDEAKPPLPGHWTVLDRLLSGKEVVVPGDGTSLWTLTHAREFAIGLAGLLGNMNSVGEAFHITSDDVYTWDQIYETIANAAGVVPRLAHVPSEFLRLAAPEWRWAELIYGHLQYSEVFDNSKIRRFVPDFVPTVRFHDAAREILHWREQHPAMTQPEAEIVEILQRLADGYRASSQLFSGLAPDMPG